MKNGAELIRIERLRQIMKLDYGCDHDDRHRARQLAKMADSYLATHAAPDMDHPKSPHKMSVTWTWPGTISTEHFKPSKDPVRNLVIAGALIAAEIDRLQRMKK